MYRVRLPYRAWRLTGRARRRFLSGQASLTSMHDTTRDGEDALVATPDDVESSHYRGISRAGDEARVDDD